jgi:heptosyltransferase-2
MSQPQEILVRGPNWTGDLIMASPGFRALRAGFPDARITLHVRPGLIPLVSGAPWFEEVLPVHSYRQGLPALLREASRLRARRYDLGLCLPDSFSAALLMRAAGVAQVVGYARGWRRPLLHRAVEPPGGRGGRLMIARELHVLGLVEALGCPAQGTELQLFASEQDRAGAARELRRAGLAEDRPYAVLAPGASFGPSKLWPAHYFANVGDRLVREGVQLAVVGTAEEAPLVAQVCGAMEEPAADLAGRLDLGALKAVLSAARLLVCNDAGARHVAVAFGVPCVVMMGPTALEKTNMNLERVSVLTADVECRPCYKRECPIDHRCMTRISPEAVMAEAQPALAPAGADGFRGVQKVIGGERGAA